MKLCKDCEFYSYTRTAYWDSEKCLHPESFIIDPVDGERILVKVRALRADETKCGKEGKWWKEKSEALKVVGHPAKIKIRDNWWWEK